MGENAKTQQRYLRSLIIKVRAMMKRVWRILPTVIAVSLVVCAIVWMIGVPHDAVAPIVAVVLCIMFLPRHRGYRICS